MSENGFVFPEDKCFLCGKKTNSEILDCRMLICKSCFRKHKRKLKEEWNQSVKEEAAKKISEEEIEKTLRSELENELGEGDIVFALRNSDSLCDQCGECCRRSDPIILSLDDVSRLEEKFGPIEVQQYIKREDGKFMLKETQPCRFLGEDDRCDIYESRPTVCRQFPVNRTEKDIPTFGSYFYCSFVGNIFIMRSIGKLIQKLMKKEAPETAKELEEKREKANQILEDQDDMSSRLKIMDHIMSEFVGEND